MPTPAYTARIQGNSYHVMNVTTGQIAFAITPSQPPLRVDVSGEFVSLTLRSGRVEIYNIRTRQLLRVF